MKLKLMLAVVALLICFSSVAAYADTLTFTINNPVQNVLQNLGGTLTFQATVSAPSSNSATLYLNSDNFTSFFALNDDGFFNNFFPLNFDPGTTFTGTLFTVTVPPNTNPGTYVGSFSILGGSDFNASANLGTASFTVNAVPEPSSMVLLVTGVAGGLARFRKNFGGLSRKS